VKIGGLILSVHKASKLGPEEIADTAYLQARERLRSDMRDSHSDVRQLIAKVARAAAKDYFDEMSHKSHDPTYCLGRSAGCGCPEGICRLVDRCTCLPGVCSGEECKVCTVNDSLCLGVREPE